MSQFHSLTIEETFKKLKTSDKGLEKAEAEKRLKKNGPNKLSEKKSLGKLEIFLSQFKSPLIYILLISGGIALFFGEYIDAGVILAAVFLNTIIGFFQENKANDALKQLKKMVERKAFVIRGGEEHEISGHDLVEGDVIVLQAGKRVPADLRIIEAVNLSIDEANLTGESAPISKKIRAVNKGTVLADRTDMAYSGTVVSGGSGKGVVVAVGDETEIGKIAQMVESAEEEKTPLQIRLGKFSSFIGILIAAISFLVVFIGVWQGRDFFEMFIMGVAIAVAAIPEGLVVAVTVILVLGMQKILKEKALTRKLVAVETLGSITVICSDKTGTLTEGKMHVAHIVVGEKEFEVGDGGSRQAEGEAKYSSLALQIGALCNDAVIEKEEGEGELGKSKFLGNPTETALLSAAIQSGIDRAEILKREPKIATLPFDSAYKYMITLHKRQENGYVLYEKGASEKLLDKSASFAHGGKIAKLTSAKKKKLLKNYENLTKKGLRVIGVAIRNISDSEFKKKIKTKKTVYGEKILENVDWDLVDNDLTFIGFIALKDPLRAEAAETIHTCRQAGIRPVIITGDHKFTAAAVASEAGIKVESKDVITGDVLDDTSDKDLRKLVKKADVYARVSPHHKLRIIKAFQANNEVVAMTGDGVNDSPALKVADIGVALGAGTDIAKETADIVLLDDNFKTIVSAIRQGRVIFSNIRKVIAYLVSDSFSEVILIVGSIMVGSPLALLPTQILWINIINDGLPNFALAFEEGDKDIMTRKPLKKEEPIVNKEMKVIILLAGTISAVAVFAIFMILLRSGAEVEYARTIVFTAVGLDSLFYIFSLRNLEKSIWHINPFRNRYLLWAVGISFLMLAIAVYLPFFNKILHTVPLDLRGWGLVIGYSTLSLAFMEAAKYYFISRKKT